MKIVDTEASSSSYDWCRDIWIPAAGNILIPLAIAFFTWFFGASHAEKQKEMRELRDNLNLLLSVCLDAISKLISLKAVFVNILQVEQKIEQKKEIDENDIKEISKVISSPIDFSVINIEKYSPCIFYSDNYIIDLLNIKSGLDLKDFSVDHHNSQLKYISDIQDKHQKFIELNEFIKIELKDIPVFISKIDGLVILLRDFIAKTEGLEKKIKGLELDKIRYSNEQKQFFAEMDQRYIKEEK